MPIPRVAFGPISSNGSWRWVGFDTAREVSKYFDIELFHSYESVPRADVIVCVKEIPTQSFLDHAFSRSCRIIYVPIDFFRLAEEIGNCSERLMRCDLLLSHSERLIPFLQPYAHVEYVDHHTKFVLPAMASYKSDGYILWVGHLPDLHWTLAAIKETPLRHELVLLTRLPKARNKAAWQRCVEALPSDMPISCDHVGGYRAFEWSDRRQLEMMNDCKGAIDIKGGPSHFNQFTKPATKVQKYISNGIPCATNFESYSAEKVRKSGFQIALPEDQERWFSQEYWEETRSFGVTLRSQLTLEAIGLRYRSFIDGVLEHRFNDLATRTPGHG